MEPLSKNYLETLNVIKKDIQESDILAKYLEEEEDELYRQMTEQFEPRIDALHREIGDKHPLQLIPFEKELINPDFEGLFLPRILGYSVMRGEINSQFRYAKPQRHFKDILLAICASANFDQLKKRIGQSIQMGFALSSDIWITNLFNLIDNKLVLTFLKAQNLEQFRDQRSRHTAYVRYKKQFENFNFLSANFPDSTSSLRTNANVLKAFLLFRAKSDFDNSSLIPLFRDFISKDEFAELREFVVLFMTIVMFFDLEEKDHQLAKEKFEELRSKKEGFKTEYFLILVEMLRDPDIPISADQDMRMSKLIGDQKKDEINKYYRLVDVVHGLGYVHEDAIEAVRNYYYQHKGLSVQNECVRLTILSYCSTLMANLDESAYLDYFEMNKIFIQYMNIFSNEKFNQQIKSYSLAYVKKLLKRFTDKRAKDYQDIKKFVTTTFTDLGFLKSKELVELFKTRRKKKIS